MQLLRTKTSVSPAVLLSLLKTTKIEMNCKGMSGQTIISIISTNLGPFGAKSGITVGQSSSIR